MNPTLIVVVGPTGIGKTKVSIDLAKYLNTEIISADSRQIFAETVIGTAQPSQAELSAVKHHLIGHKSIKDYYNASLFEQEVISLLKSLFTRYNSVIMTGGSGLYIDAVLKGIDDLPTIEPSLRKEVLHTFEDKGLQWLQQEVETIDPVYFRNVDKNNPKRLLKAIEVFRTTGKPYSAFLTHPAKQRPFNHIKIGLNMDRTLLYERINNRVDKMVEAGLLKEAYELYQYRQLNALNTVGYRELFECFEGTVSQAEAIKRIKANSRKYARRQLTWFRRDSDITWFQPHETHKIQSFISSYFKNQHK